MRAPVAFRSEVRKCLSMVKEEYGRGRSAIWQRYEEATLRQRRPADPTDPGDAADLSIMGYAGIVPGNLAAPGSVCKRHLRKGLYKSIVS